MKKVFFSIILFCCFIGLIKSQVSFVASANKVVELGENDLFIHNSDTIIISKTLRDLSIINTPLKTHAANLPIFKHCS